MSDPDYVQALLFKLKSVKFEIAEQQGFIRKTFERVDQLQKQAENIVELLNAEGVEPDKSELEALGQVSVSDLAYEYLDQSNDQKPMHYRELSKTLLANSKVIPGKDPDANLLSHISRDERFVRVSPGTYGLKEWGLKPTPQKRRKRRKST